MIPGLSTASTNLLLMVPALGEFTRGIEPVGGFFFARPAHREHGCAEGIERLVVFRAFARGRFHSCEISSSGAELAVLANALRIE